MSDVNLGAVPFRPTSFLAKDVEVTRRNDGTLLLKSRLPLQVREASLPAYLRRQAARRPDVPWLFQRTAQADAWCSISYGETRRLVDSLTQALLDLQLRPGAPLAILSGNTIEHALMTFAAMQAGIVVAPISTAYSLQSTDFAKLREVVSVVQPGAVFVQNGKAFGRALDALQLGNTPVIVVEDLRGVAGEVAYAELASRPAGPEVERVLAALNPHAAAKLMFTSGSTGSPKAVIQTQWTMSFAAEAILASFGHNTEGSMVRLDWMPWSHVFGATSLAMALMCGGAFYIDDGRPGGAAFLETLRNLRDVSPTTYAGVPAAYGALVQAMEQDEVLARNFFAQLDMLTYAGARLPDETAHRLQKLAVKHTGFKIPFTTGYGSTETGPGGSSVHWPTDLVGFIGLPQPGFEFKLVPLDDDRYEIRIRGDGLTLGYYGQPELTAQSFDDEGFFRMGDAARFVDAADPLQGLSFAGRLSEEFKLQTGTFVLAGSLRVTVVEAAAPLLQDAVVCGDDEAYVAVLAWLNLQAARELVQQPQATREALNRDPLVRQRVAELLATHNAKHPGSSTRIARFHLLDEMPSIDLGEITDKGSINQRGVQRHRRPLVQALFAHVPGDDVVTVGAAAAGARRGAS